MAPTLAPAKPGRNGAPPPADPTLEYVAGGLLGISTAVYRTLPRWIDPLTREFGDNLYERMLQDSQVAAAVHGRKMGALAQPITVSPKRKEGQPDYAWAAEIAEFCARLLSRLRKLRSHTLYDMLDAIMVGSKIAEKVWVEADRGPDKGRLVLADLKVKPRRCYAFLMDPWMNLIGILVVIPGKSPVLPAVPPGTPLNKIEGLLPPEKFAILTYRMKEGDPRGQSAGECIYDPWWVKQQLKPEWLKYMARFASPALVGTTPEKALPQPKLDAAGAPMLASDGTQLVVPAGQQMFDNLVKFQNGSIVIIPFGAKLDTLEPIHVGNQFPDAMKVCDMAITMGIMGSTLATNEGEHQARAASQTHENSLAKTIQYDRTLVEDMIESALFVPAVGYAFGPDAVELVPDASLGDVEAKDVAGMVKAFAAYVMSGAADPSQLQGMDAMAGLPIRTAEEVAARQKRQEAAPEPPQGERPPGLEDEDEGKEDEEE